MTIFLTGETRALRKEYAAALENLNQLHSKQSCKLEQEIQNGEKKLEVVLDSIGCLKNDLPEMALALANEVQKVHEIYYTLQTDRHVLQLEQQTLQEAQEKLQKERDNLMNELQKERDSLNKSQQDLQNQTMLTLQGKKTVEEKNNYLHYELTQMQDKWNKQKKNAEREKTKLKDALKTLESFSSLSEQAKTQLKTLSAEEEQITEQEKTHSKEDDATVASSFFQELCQDYNKIMAVLKEEIRTLRSGMLVSSASRSFLIYNGSPLEYKRFFLVCRSAF